MRVVSWNIELGLGVDRAIDALATHPKLKDADLVLLQEMDDVGTEQIARALGLSFGYRAGCKHTDTGKPFGNAILARGDVGEATALRLPHLGRFMGMRRVAVNAVVSIPTMAGSDDRADAIEISVWSVHAEISTLPHKQQVAQYRTIADHVIADRYPATIVGGDFNTASQRSIRGLVDNMERAGTRRVLDAGTHSFVRFGRPWELDHLFVAGLEVAANGVVRGHGASDHDPVWADLAPPTAIPPT